jgi:RNA polymerase sigma-70 factor (ECF subfamily)
MNEDDKILVRKVVLDDKVAFQKLFSKYAERIYYFAMHYIRNKEEAEEIAQEVFVKIWTRRFDLKEELSFSSYAFTIAKNALIDTIRRKNKEIEFHKNFISYSNNNSPSTDESLEYGELNAIIEESIRELPSKRKQIYLLSRNEGLTYKQISEKLNISIKTVETHMRLALQQLKKNVKNNYEFSLALFIITCSLW